MQTFLTLRMNKTDMFRKLYFLGCLLALALVFVQCQSDNKALHKKLADMAANLNVSTPTMLDANTRFDSASVTRDNIFRYHYTVLHTSDPDSTVTAMLPGMKDRMKGMFTTHPDLRIFTQNKVSIEYIYSDSLQHIIQTITITPQDYQ
ncbi:MAG TPA: hypothetical protein DDZ96_00600 [Porphyromonadaceae bacterium]|nr:hypothetical protein [Porphyromonadaceae bacterium]HBL32303.1 hypothetical protein [Porphyromonadaceae bacterium]HBX45659.1 hypothetical protein [Porphyromonadaceae bacterium]